MRFRYSAAALIGLLAIGSTDARAASPKLPAKSHKPAPAKISAAAESPFAVANWFSVEPIGGQLIRHDAIGKALTEPATGEWEEITVFAHKKDKNRELAYERAHAGDPVYEAATSDLAQPSIKMAPALNVFDLKF